jgi:uncharacterized membrane protein HdeD (DUF308 family)
MTDNSTRDMETVRAVIADGIRHNWWVFLAVGVVMMVLGALAFAMPFISTLTIEILIGWLFFVGGIVRMLALAKAHRMPGWIWSFASAALAAVLGLVLVFKPLVGVLSMTMVLAGLFVIEGVGSILAALDTRLHVQNWGWSIISGLVSLALAYLIWRGWPATAAWAVGLLAGINLFFIGLALVMLSLGALSLPRR